MNCYKVHLALAAHGNETQRKSWTIRVSRSDGLPIPAEDAEIMAQMLENFEMYQKEATQRMGGLQREY